MTRKEWLVLAGIMALFIVVGLVVTFVLGGGSGSPTQRHPPPGAAAAPRVVVAPIMVTAPTR